MTEVTTGAKVASDTAPAEPASGGAAAPGAAHGGEVVIRSRSEIIASLATILREHEPVTIHLKGEDFVLSGVLAIDADADRVVFAYGLDKHRNAALLRVKRLACECAHRDSKLQFPLEHPEETLFQGEPAFAAALPSYVCRLQRRRERRFKVPKFAPLLATLDFGVLGTVEVEVVDVSLSGIGMIACPADVVLAPGECLTGCKIRVPGTSAVAVDLRVAHTKDCAPLDAGQPMRRIGCEFIAPRAELTVLIEHYIVQIAPDGSA